ncbi:phage tail sheath family protein [Alteromonas sp. a30]|uniref:phage tail sheath family protein n=1 Tax=Alteromonas sp. a30 TaxID=2730917 RepID=UPI0022830563|nr:phage tail sheath C-terminal domain-containing protein [Alteromonas sp. a30]MCY7296515.1 phage tail sheath family protein [Alteromonas sp. a30]
MSQYKTPDVYVKERSLLSPSVAQVPTAIPAFIGYTETTENSKGESIVQKATRITSLLEYTAMFGGPFMESMDVKYQSASGEFVLDKASETNSPMSHFFLYQSVKHFFANGGGTCYIVSVGGYDTPMKTKDGFMKAIEGLSKVDEVTLISSPESVLLDSQSHYDIQNCALAHAEKMMDRFAIVDVQEVGGIRDDAAVMRDKVTQGLKYGAAYYPYLTTSMSRSYDEDNVMVVPPMTFPETHITMSDFYALTVEDDAVVPVAVDAYGKSGSMYYSQFFIKHNDMYLDFAGFQVESVDAAKVGQRVEGAVAYGIYAAKDNADVTVNAQGQMIDNSAADADRKPGAIYAVAMKQSMEPVPLKSLNKPAYRFASTGYYNQVKAMLSKQYLVLPPSAAIAGVMAKTDAQRGVWKAPANVAIAQVIAPSVSIDNGEQEDLNVDVNAGKSINAIRSFVGKGTLVWGARTLDGNSNEWRYVPVRRLFNMVEESVKKASYFAVFEPNTPFTWLKIKTTIESYLENLWKQGAFFGASPDQAYFVNVGLGQTMTEDDINNGIMNIEIGIAAVRPAEFIVLTFSHKSIEG